jgi:hypothetical protein
MVFESFEHVRSTDYESLKGCGRVLSDLSLPQQYNHFAVNFCLSKFQYIYFVYPLFSKETQQY